MPPTVPTRDDELDDERVLHAMADHLHDHCACTATAPRCASCDLRAQLREVRESLLAWRAEGRRLAAVRRDALANAGEHGARTGSACATCAAIAALARSLPARRDPREERGPPAP